MTAAVKVLRKVAGRAAAPLRWAATPSPHPVSRGVAYGKLAVGAMYACPALLLAWPLARLM